MHKRRLLCRHTDGRAPRRWESSAIQTQDQETQGLMLGLGHFQCKSELSCHNTKLQCGKSSNRIKQIILNKYITGISTLYHFMVNPNFNYETADSKSDTDVQSPSPNL